MSIIVNGVTIPTTAPIYYNGNKVEKVICNDVEVWKMVQESFLYKDGVFLPGATFRRGDSCWDVNCQYPYSSGKAICIEAGEDNDHEVNGDKRGWWEFEIDLTPYTYVSFTWGATGYGGQWYMGIDGSKGVTSGLMGTLYTIGSESGWGWPCVKDLHTDTYNISNISGVHRVGMWGGNQTWWNLSELIYTTALKLWNP